jgi:hypothetical protein
VPRPRLYTRRSPSACGGTGRRARLRALWAAWPVEVRILSGALERPRICGAFSCHTALARTASRCRENTGENKRSAVCAPLSFLARRRRRAGGFRGHGHEDVAQRPPPGGLRSAKWPRPRTQRPTTTSLPTSAANSASCGDPPKHSTPAMRMRPSDSPSQSACSFTTRDRPIRCLANGTDSGPPRHAIHGERQRVRRSLGRATRRRHRTTAEEAGRSVHAVVDNREHERRQRRALLTQRLRPDGRQQGGWRSRDPELDAAWAALTRDNSLGWGIYEATEEGERALGPFKGDVALSSVRQIAYETSATLGRDLAHLLESSGSGQALSPLQLRSAGRNDPCPCGSARKLKKCHGAASAVAS